MNDFQHLCFQAATGRSARARDMPNRDTSPEEPVILPHEPRNFNIVCIDLKRRTLYPFGTQTSNEPFFWSRTVSDDFNKSYLYLRSLCDMHDGTQDPLQNQAEWWFDVGDDLMQQVRAGNMNESRPSIPAPPIIPASESLICYHLIEKKLWYMCSPTVEILSWNDTYNHNDLARIGGYLSELLEHWESNTRIPTPLDMINADYDGDDDLDIDDA